MPTFGAMTSSGLRTGRRTSGGAAVVGGFYLVMGGVHLGIVAADPLTYEGFAQRGLFGFVRSGWSQVVMADPTVWGLLLVAGEVTLGTLLLLGGRSAVVGWVGVIAFHVLLMLFGWWVWVWSVPALAVLVPLARRDVRDVRATSGRGRPVQG